ncbi:hypothetical protein ACGIF2_13280 [Cellulomonas sp. P22]|uniref:hypothetical protein n=1 Tax=Cellulomonas sp. P22 TaxID=3373189 RepID=UPI0037B6E26E
MAGEIELDSEVLSARVARLTSILDNLEILQGAVAEIGGNQDTTRWSAAPGPDDFSRTLAASLDEARGFIARLHATVDKQITGLSTSASALLAQDAAAAASLTAAANRLAGLQGRMVPL